MKVLHLMFAVSEQSAAYRLHQSLLAEGVKSEILVAFTPIENDVNIYQITKFARFVNKGYSFLERKLAKVNSNDIDTPPFYLNFFSSSLQAELKSIQPDLIHLHWICGSFASMASIAKIKLPMLWTMHDSWAFTGGCNVPDECKQYETGCIDCPLVSGFVKTLVKRACSEKKVSWKNINLVTPSNWLAKCASSSAVFKDREVSVIPNAINTAEFKNDSLALFRSQYGLSEGENLIAFGAMNFFSKNKGFDLLSRALLILKDKIDFTLVVFGASEQVEIDGVKVLNLGRISKNNDLVTMYSALDAAVVPSRSENFPNTILEALSCGVPCVGFDIGGIPDQLEHKINGYLAEPYSYKDLSEGLLYLLQNKKEMKGTTRQKVLENYSLEVVAKKYKALYSTILSS